MSWIYLSAPYSNYPRFLTVFDCFGLLLTTIVTNFDFLDFLVSMVIKIMHKGRKRKSVWGVLLALKWSKISRYGFQTFFPCQICKEVWFSHMSNDWHVDMNVVEKCTEQQKLPSRIIKGKQKMIYLEKGIQSALNHFLYRMPSFILLVSLCG